MSAQGRAPKPAGRARGREQRVSRAVQLFCLPYAGASASVYCRWQSRLPSWVEVCPVELPGHGRNIAEAPLGTVAAMVERVLPSVQRSVRGPFALFGHSMGAVLAFELARSLESAARAQHADPAGGSRPSRQPSVVFASGTDAPSRRDPERYRQLESDASIIAELQRLAGTPAAVLADAELMELALPALRADFAACSAYRASAEQRVVCPIDVLGGTRDTTTREGLEAWRDHTSSEFSLRMFSGGHFFIHDQVEAVLEHLVERLDARDVHPKQAGAGHAGERPSPGRARAALGDPSPGEGVHG